MGNFVKFNFVSIPTSCQSLMLSRSIKAKIRHNLSASALMFIGTNAKAKIANLRNIVICALHACHFLLAIYLLAVCPIVDRAYTQNHKNKTRQLLIAERRVGYLQLVYYYQFVRKARLRFSVDSTINSVRRLNVNGCKSRLRNKQGLSNRVCAIFIIQATYQKTGKGHNEHSI